MKLTTCIFLFIGFTHLYSQNIDLNQLVLWRGTNYKIVDQELLKMGWEKSIPKEDINNYKNNLYFLNKGSNNEKVLTLICTDDYEIKNNSLSYNSVKNENYDDFINQIISLGYVRFKSVKNGNVISEYYKSKEITIVVSVLKGIDKQMQEMDFLTVNLSTNEDYDKSHKG
jgi:hypothetical protein